MANLNPRVKSIAAIFAGLHHTIMSTADTETAVQAIVYTWDGHRFQQHSTGLIQAANFTPESAATELDTRLPGELFHGAGLLIDRAGQLSISAHGFEHPI